MDNPNFNIIETAISAGKELAPKVITSPILDGKPFVILESEDGSQRALYLDERFEAPVRKRNILPMADAASFCHAWDSQAELGKSAIYADKHKRKFTAVLDEHDEQPDYREHRITLTLNQSAEYIAWNQKNGKPFDGNESFAEFIEENLPDFATPSGAAMLEMALNFKINASASFSNMVRLTDGNTQFTYSNESQSGAIKTPDKFTIVIPVHDGLSEPSYVFDARFRYRLNGPKLTIWYELIRPHKVLDKAFADVAASIEEKCKSTILFGSPE